MTSETTTETLQWKRYAMDPDRVEVRTVVETDDLRVDVSVEGRREDADVLQQAVQAGIDAARAVTQ